MLHPRQVNVENKAVKKSALKSSQCILICMDDKCKKKAKKLKQDIADALSDRGLDDQIVIHATACMHRCDGGPNVEVYPGGVAYAKVSRKGVERIVKDVAEAVGKS